MVRYWFPVRFHRDYLDYVSDTYPDDYTIANEFDSGKAYGTFNVKWTHVISVIIFIVGSAVCGAAPNMNALIVGRVIAGVGGAGMYLGTLNLVAINTTITERPLYLGGVGITWGLGTILGPVIGGAFADSGATWRWVSILHKCQPTGANSSTRPSTSTLSSSL